MWVSGVARLVVWVHRVGTKRFLVIYSRSAFARSDERRRRIKRRALEAVGGTVRETSRFSQRRKKFFRAESRACSTYVSSADKAAALQKQAPMAKNTGGVYARGIEGKRERKKMYPGSEKGAEWWGQFTRETHANARPRVRELRRGRYNAVPMVHANRTEITGERKARDKRGGLLTFHLER